MVWLFVSLALAGEGPGWDEVPPLTNIAVLESATPQLRWVQAQGDCERGFDVTGPTPVRVAVGACPATPLSAPEPRTTRRLRRAARGKRVPSVRVLGDYRRLMVREVVRLPDAPHAAVVLGTGGRVVYALDAGSLELRTLARHGGGTQVLCSEVLSCAGEGHHQALAWTAPPAWRGLSIVGAAARGEAPEGAMAALERATLQALKERDRGELQQRAVDRTPDGPLTTDLGLTWTLTLSGAALDEPVPWTLEIPNAWLGQHLRATRTFPEVGLRVRVDLGPGGTGSLTWTGPDREPHTRPFRLNARTAQWGTSTVVLGQPEVDDLSIDHALGTPGWFVLRGDAVRLAEHPVPDGVHIERVSRAPRPDPAAGARAEPPDDLDPPVLLAPARVRLRRGVRLVQSSGDPSLRVEEDGTFEKLDVTLDPRRPLLREVALFLGQQPPPADRTPDVAEQHEIPALGDTDSLSLRLHRQALVDPHELAVQGAWLVYRWMQDERVVAFRAYRVPPRRMPTEVN